MREKSSPAVHISGKVAEEEGPATEAGKEKPAKLLMNF